MFLICIYRDKKNMAHKNGGWRNRGDTSKSKVEGDGAVNFGAADVKVEKGKAKKRKGDTGVIRTVTSRLITSLRLFNNDFVAELGEVKRDISGLYYMEGNKAIIDIPVYPDKFDNHLQYHRVILWELDELEGGKIEDYIKTAKNWVPPKHATVARSDYINNKTVFLIIGKQLGKINPGVWKRDIGTKKGTILLHKFTKKGGYTDGRYLAKKILRFLADFFEFRINRLAEVMDEKKIQLFDKMATIDLFLRRVIVLFRDATKAAALLYMWEHKENALDKAAEKYMTFLTERAKPISGG